MLGNFIWTDQRVYASKTDLPVAFHAPKGVGTAQGGQNGQCGFGIHVGGGVKGVTCSESEIDEGERRVSPGEAASALVFCIENGPVRTNPVSEKKRLAGAA